MVRFGRNLKTIRHVRNLTVADLASRVAVTPTTLTSYEKGMRTPTLAILCRLQDELGVGADILLTSDLCAIPEHMLHAGLKSIHPRKAVLQS